MIISYLFSCFLHCFSDCRFYYINLNKSNLALVICDCQLKIINNIINLKDEPAIITSKQY